MPFLKISIDFYDKQNTTEYEHKCITPFCSEITNNTSGTAAARGFIKAFEHGVA